MVALVKQDRRRENPVEFHSWWTRLRWRYLLRQATTSSPTEPPTPAAGPTSGDIRLRAGSRCARGGYRACNQDKCYADVRRGVFLVADGMGGYAGGGEASGLVVETIPPILAAALRSGGARLSRIESAVERSIELARRRMLHFAQQHAGCGRMGATLGLVAAVNRTAYVARVGDCRVYLARDGLLHRLTSDQTYAQTLVDAGVVTPEEARNSTYRHIVTNSVSTRPLQATPRVLAVPLRRADRMLLATDGLTSALDDESISQAIWEGSPQQSADQLVLQALRRDCRDNVACVVVKVLP